MENRIEVSFSLASDFYKRSIPLWYAAGEASIIIIALHLTAYSLRLAALCSGFRQQVSASVRLAFYRPEVTVVTMMKRCPIGLLALLLSGLFALPSFGQTNAPMRFSIHDACEGTGCPRYVLANGVIDKGTPKKFINFMKSIDFKPPVYFHSPGGDLGAGLELAITIRQYALDTYVGGPYEEMVSPSQPYRVLVERAACYSACAYAFLGGISRELGETGSYGVHQFFRQKGASKEGNVQIAAAMLEVDPIVKTNLRSK